MANERLSPYLRRALEAAAARALEIHADEVGREHLFERLFADEDCALHRAVLDAFADPDGMAIETLALAPGILVVGAGVATPFSARAVDAMRDARRLAIEHGASEVGPGEVLLACARHLEDGAREALVDAGLRSDAAHAEASSGASPIREEGHLFAAFSGDARKLLVQAARDTGRADEPAISPARLFLAALASDRSLAAENGLTSHRARLVLDGRTRDTQPPPSRELPVEPRFEAFLGELSDGAGSLEAALVLLRDPADELAQVMVRQKIGPERLDAARGAFSDPD